MDSVYGNYWVCNCSPYRENIQVIDKTDTYPYIGINKDINVHDDGEFVEIRTVMSI